MIGTGDMEQRRAVYRAELLDLDGKKIEGDQQEAHSVVWSVSATAVADKGRQDSKVVGGGVTGVSIAGGVLVVSTALTADTVRKTPFLSHFMPNPPLKSAMTGSG